MLRQGTLFLKMREFTMDDYERLLEVYNANYPDYTRSVNEWRSRDEAVDKSKYLLKRFTFPNPKTGKIVGFGEIYHAVENFHPRKLWINIYVDPAEQGKGIGDAIYRALIEQLHQLGAILVSTFAKEDLPRLVGFLERRGFEQKFRAWESRLDVASTDITPFRRYAEKVAKDRLTMTTLAEERKNGTGSLRELYELVQLITADMPTPQPFTPISFEQWEAFELKNPSLMPDAYMIAKDETRYVGLSTVWSSDKEPKSLYQGNTGVRRDYRGRGIAIALKLKVIDYALQHGYEKVKTWNASNNPAMLGINTKLGFKREVGWLTMEKDLASPSVNLAK
jgi:GNAT superfamily N-acetyltransferase